MRGKHTHSGPWGRAGRGRRAILGAAIAAVLGAAMATAAPSTAAAAPSSARPYAAHLTRAPYLTDLVGLHVAINYATDRSSRQASVAYGRYVRNSGCRLTNTAIPTRVPIAVGAAKEYQWTANLTLPAIGEYCYRVYLAGADLLATNPTPVFSTQVQPGATTPFTFDVIGDWGQRSNSDDPALMRQIAATHARFAVTVGDNGYPNGNEFDYGDLRQTGGSTGAIFAPDMWTVASERIALFTAVGNHGLTGPRHTDITTWTEAAAVAESGGTYGNTLYCCVDRTTSENLASDWYAFTVGNTRFYILDAAWADANPGLHGPYVDDLDAHWAPGAAEYRWLLSDLKKNPSQLKFAFFHYPLYSDVPGASSDIYLDGPTKLEGILARNGVKMVFNGHAHVYERNRASAAGMPITYVTGEGGGQPEAPAMCSSLDEYSIGWYPNVHRGKACGAGVTPTSEAQVFSFLRVTVSGTTVSVVPINSLGHAFDAATYHFAAPPK